MKGKILTTLLDLHQQGYEVSPDGDAWVHLLDTIGESGIHEATEALGMPTNLIRPTDITEYVGRKAKGPKALDITDGKILAVLSETKPMTPKDIAIKMGMSTYHRATVIRVGRKLTTMIDKTVSMKSIQGGKFRHFRKLPC